MNQGTALDQRRGDAGFASYCCVVDSPRNAVSRLPLPPRSPSAAANTIPPCCREYGRERVGPCKPQNVCGGRLPPTSRRSLRPRDADATSRCCREYCRERGGLCKPQNICGGPLSQREQAEPAPPRRGCNVTLPGISWPGAHKHGVYSHAARGIAMAAHIKRGCRPTPTRPIYQGRQRVISRLPYL